MTELPKGLKIDPAKYIGLSPEEARRQMEEDERKAINADPGLQAHIRDMDRRAHAAKAEERREAVRLEELQEKRFAEALEAQYQDRLRFYSLQGVPKKVFDEEIWPMQRQLFILGEEDAVDHERRERSSSPF